MPMLEPEALERSAEAWHSVLFDVKTEHLRDAYVEAHKSRSHSEQARPLTAYQVRYTVDQHRRRFHWITCINEWRDALTQRRDGCFETKKPEEVLVVW